MLSDWYFCSSVGFDPKQTSVFLTIMHVIRNVDDKNILFLTYRELMRSNVWMQVYALPQVLRRQQAKQQEDMTGVPRAYLMQMIERVTDDSQRTLLADLYAGKKTGGAGFVRQIEEVARALVELSIDREPATTPYLDLELFLPEALFAAYLFGLCMANDRLSDLLSTRLSEGEISSLRRFLNMALENQFGRLVFRLGLRLNARLLPDFSIDLVHEALWNLDNAVADLEPDLMQTLLNVLFIDRTGDAANDPEQVGHMLNEVQTMRHYRAFSHARSSYDANLSDGVMLRLGMATRSEVDRIALPLVLWQTLLWQTACDVVPQRSAAQLLETWSPPRGYKASVTLHMDSNQDDSRSTFFEWRDQLNALAKFHDASVHIHSKHDERQTVVTGESRWLFFSPWIPLGQKPFHKDGERYPEARNQALLIRLLGAAYTASELLLHLDDGPEKVLSASLVIHAKNVIDHKYGEWLRDHASAKSDSRELSPRITGLMLFCNEHIKRLTYNHGISPNVFLEPRLQINAANTMKHSFDEKEFVRVVLPEVLISLVHDVYKSIAGPEKAGHWLPLIPEIYSYLEEAEWRTPRRVRQLGALIYRYLAPNAPPRDLSEFDWQESLKKGKPVYHRQLLLTPALPISIWMEFEPILYDAERRAVDDADNKANKKKTQEEKIREARNRALVRTIEQLSALDNDTTLDADTRDSLRAQWLNDWRASMETIHRNQNLDRFVRLRLLELLDSKILANSPEDQLLIIYPILEFGSIYEIDQLVKRVFWNEPNRDMREADIGLAPTSYSRHQVRLSVLQYMVKQVKFGALLDEDDEISTPYTILGHLKRGDYVRNFVRRIALEATRLTDDAQARELVAELVTLRDSLLAQAMRVAQGQLQTEIRRQSHHENLYPIGDSQHQVEDWQIGHATVDPNHETAVVHYEEIDIRDCHNFFSASDSSMRTFLDSDEKGPFKVVARLMKRVRSQHKDDYVYDFSVGLRFPIRGIFDKAVYSASGFLELEIERTNKTGKDEWEATGRQPRPLYIEKRVGDIIRGPDITESYDAVNEIRLFDVKPPYASSRRYNRRYWDADLSRRFAPFFRAPNAMLRSQPFAYLASEYDECPHEASFEDLLISGHALGTGAKQVYVLVLIEVRDPDPLTGDSVYLFATRPGFNFLLNGQDFVPALLHEIEAALGTVTDPSGLLVTAQPQVQSDGHVRLIAAPELPSDDTLHALFPDLELPLDERNWNWRDLFEHDEDDNPPIASRDPRTRRWVYHIPPGRLHGGFPDQLEVRFKDTQPPDSATECEMRSPLWRDWLSYKRPFVVEAYAPPHYSIDPQGGDDNFFYRWQNLRLGHRVQIVRVIGTVHPESDGSVMCLTDEGIGISVQADSLTLDMVKVKERLYFNSHYPRKTEITRVTNWRALREAVHVTADSEIPTLEGYCEGVLLSMPVDVKVSQRCEVLWRISGGTRRSTIHITNLETLGPNFRPGCRISGTVKGSQSQLTAASRLIFGRALWQRTLPYDTVQVPERLSYLGEMILEDRSQHIACGFAGQLVILPHDFPGALHLSTVTKRVDGRWHIEGGLQPNLRVTYHEPKRAHNERGKFRVVVLCNDDVIVGYSSLRIVGTRLQLAGVECTLEERDDAYVAVERTLRVVSQADEPDKKRETFDRREVYEAALNRYLSDPNDIEAHIQDGFALLTDLHVPDNMERRTWSRKARLHDSETYIAGNSYAPEGLVQVLELADRHIVASTRAAIPYDVQRYYYELGTPLNREITLDENLYYVGPELIPNSLAQPSGDASLFDPTITAHRFEWGYGKTLLVPESHLLFDGRPFHSGQMLLFYGDYITGIEFLAGEMPHEFDEESSAEPELFINIHNYHLSFSQGRRLFMQRRHFRMVHLVHLVVSDGEPIVRYVEAFNEEDIRQINTDFHRMHGTARLSEDSVVRLQARLNPIADEGREIVINGRLNEQAYLDSLGRIIEFDHVYLGFETGQGAAPLQDDELVFMDGGQIDLLPNDQALNLHPPAVLEREDVSPAMTRRLLILRRQLSVREDILLRVYKENPNYLQRRLLVRLSQTDGGLINASMVNNIPPRKPRAIVSGGQPMVILALWIRKSGGDRPENLTIDLELRPGVTVRLGNTQECSIESYPKDVERGAIVRVKILERTQTHIRLAIVLASFSDSHYVPESGRLAVALPKNSLLEGRRGSNESGGTEDAFWNNLFGFTIGGLPNIVAAPGTFDKYNRSWRHPRAQDFLRLMQTPHPKIVHLQRDGNQYRVAVRVNDSTTGRLRIEKDNAMQMIGYGETGAQMLHWRYQTFAHESIAEVKARLEREKWQYHDDRTGYWQQDVQKTYHESLGDHSAQTGPLFFQHDKKAFKLRYDEQLFLQFGYPVGELVARISQEPDHTYTCTVAGVSKDGGLWVELAPGRLCEIPQEIMVWKATATEEEKPLANFAWSLFAPGDRLTLHLVKGNVLEIDRIGFRNWVPGPRGAFGRQRTLLYVQGFDPVLGALDLGSGEYTMTLPIKQFQPNAAVMLHHDNHLSRVDQLTRGDVVLLGLGPGGEVIILGLPGYRAAADANHDWSDDPLGLVTQSGDRTRRDIDRLCDVIKAVGGALPVTVETVVDKNRVIYFSRRWQQKTAAIQPGEITIARVIGMLDDDATAVLRIGGGVLCLPFEQIISGLPHEYFARAAKFLIESNYYLWLRVDEQGKFRLGVSDETQRAEFSVRARGLLTGDDGLPLGLLCSSTTSQRLYWLPVQWLAWTPLTSRQIERLFVTASEAFLVTKYQREGISLRHLQQARELFNRLRVGDEVQVRVVELIEETDDSTFEKTAYLVQAGSNGLLLRCETTITNLDTDTDIAVEVVRRTDIEGRPDVCVMPIGERQFKLDLPTCMVDPDVPSPHERMSLYNDWCASPPDSGDFDIDALNTGDYDARIDELLCYAYAKLKQEAPDVEFQVQAAIRWHKLMLMEAEMDVALAIMAISIFFHHSIRANESLKPAFPRGDDRELKDFKRHWNGKAKELLVNLGRRALRSLHVELLANQLITQLEQEDEQGDTLYSRLNYAVSLFKLEMNREDMNTIRQFFRVTQLRSTRLSLVGKSLAVAAGQDVVFGHEEVEKSSVVTTLLELYATIYTQSGDRVRLEREYHILKLEQLLRKMEIGMIPNIILLSPLPYLVT